MESEPILDLAKPVLDAITGGQYWYAAALSVILGVALLSRYAPAKWKLDTGLGKALMVLLGTYATALISAGLGGGTPMSLALAKGALGTAVTAAGGFTLARELVKYLAMKLPLPSWIKKPLLWIFGKDVVAEAEAAGDKAVAENPPKGIVGIVGSPKEIE